VNLFYKRFNAKQSIHQGELYIMKKATAIRQNLVQCQYCPYMHEVGEVCANTPSDIYRLLQFGTQAIEQLQAGRNNLKTLQELYELVEKDGSTQSVAYQLIPVINQLQAIMNEVAWMQGKLMPNTVRMRQEQMAEDELYLDARSWI
jgi:hypothetical protein